MTRVFALLPFMVQCPKPIPLAVRNNEQSTGELHVQGQLNVRIPKWPWCRSTHLASSFAKRAGSCSVSCSASRTSSSPPTSCPSKLGDLRDHRSTCFPATPSPNTITCQPRGPGPVALLPDEARPTPQAEAGEKPRSAASRSASSRPNAPATFRKSRCHYCI